MTGDGNSLGATWWMRELGDLSADAWEALRVVSAHQLLTVVQIRRLLGKDPRRSLKELADADAVFLHPDFRGAYAATPDVAEKLDPGLDPIPEGGAQQWVWETNLCLPLLDFARSRDLEAVWHRGSDGCYDLGVSPLGHRQPARWGQPVPPADHAVFPMAIKYVDSAPIGGEAFAWAEHTRRALYDQKGWKKHFAHAPGLMMLLRGHIAAGPYETLVKYARRWRDVIEATVPGVGLSRWNLFGSETEVLFCRDKDLAVDGARAEVVNLKEWWAGGLWYNPPVETPPA